VGGDDSRIEKKQDAKMKNNYPDHMDRRPLIAVTTHCVSQSDSCGRPRSFVRLAAQYLKALNETGAVAVAVPVDPGWALDPRQLLPRFDGLLLSGGTDLPDGIFDAATPPSLRDVDPQRYDYETALVKEAWERRLPMVGICRGHQTIAEALAGRLNPRLDSESAHYQADPPSVPTHRIDVEAKSFLGSVLGPNGYVNSFHRQAVADIPDGFRVVASAEDGVIEAIESEEPFAVGLQFHPEWLYEKTNAFRKIFELFIERASQGLSGPGRIRDAES
jgi:putative glutamine amidotransferase